MVRKRGPGGKGKDETINSDKRGQGNGGEEVEERKMHLRRVIM